ncbi:MAG: 30S ribosomal protein S18 [Verrucomicrobiota bacterium]|nr:30S ribosomal protein S18 [Verrucomicrobiota bacterium]
MNSEPPKQSSIKPEEISFMTTQLMSRYVTDTGKILPQKYTGLSSKQQRAITRTLKRARNLLLAP